MLQRNRYCILRHSTKVREAILHRLKTSGRSRNEVCTKLEINPSAFHQYLFSKPTALSQFTLLQILNELKIDVTLNIEFK
jgi:hypothetical protein